MTEIVYTSIYIKNLRTRFAMYRTARTKYSGKEKGLQAEKQINRGVAQLVARDIWGVEAASSSLATPTTFARQHGSHGDVCHY